MARHGADVAAEEDGGGADGGGSDGGVADVAAVHGVVWRAARGCFAGGAAEEDLIDVGKDGIGVGSGPMPLRVVRQRVW